MRSDSQGLRSRMGDQVFRRAALDLGGGFVFPDGLLALASMME